MRGAKTQNHHIPATLPKLISLICHYLKWKQNEVAEHRGRNYLKVKAMFLFYWLVISVLSNYGLLLPFPDITFCFTEGNIFSFSNHKQRAISGRENFHSALSFSTRKKESLVVRQEESMEFWYATPQRGHIFFSLVFFFFFSKCCIPHLFFHL